MGADFLKSNTPAHHAIETSEATLQYARTHNGHNHLRFHDKVLTAHVDADPRERNSPSLSDFPAVASVDAVVYASDHHFPKILQRCVQK